MLTNYHIHTKYCDGENTPKEIVLKAIELGFQAIGFSGHSYIDFDTSYCIKDINGYINEINYLKEKYKNNIQIYLGVEEDAVQTVNRKDFDYIIGSSHYVNVGNRFYPIDLSPENYFDNIKLYNADVYKMAEEYYKNFCSYIKSRKPDIVGHFDLITKYDELNDKKLLNDENYKKIARKYMEEALRSECIFEVNTGAISRGYRKTPYPSEDLLYIIKKNDGKIILSSDSHSIDTLDFYFKEAKELLKDIGFRHTYVLYNNEFIKDYIE